MSDQYKLQLTFIRAADDPRVSDPEFQQGLRSFSAALSDAGIVYSQRVKFADSANGGGHPLGEYFISLAQVIRPIVGVAVGAWIQGRAGRKVRLKVGDIELEANGPADIDHLVAQALALKAQLAEQDAGR